MLGLVLEGGGVKGSFQVGAIKALQERGYIFDGVMGTSIGAINGAFVAQGDVEALENIWRSVKPSDVMDVEDEMIRRYTEGDLNKDVILYFSKLVYNAVKSRGLSFGKAEALLEKYLDEDKIRAAKMDFGLVTVRTSDKKWQPTELFKEDIPKGLLLKYIIASAYFPAFRREPIHGKMYVDGGLYDNMPINPLLRKGYDRIIAIRTMSNMPHQKVIDENAEVDYITPSEKLGRTLAFTQEQVHHNITLGYYDALRLTDGLVGRMYYTEPMTEESFVTYMMSFPAQIYRAWSDILGIHGDKKSIIYQFSDIIRNEYYSGFTTQETFLGLFEAVATAFGIERFKPRSLPTFVEELHEKYFELGDRKSNPTENFKLNLAVYALLNGMQEFPK